MVEDSDSSDVRGTNPWATTFIIEMTLWGALRIATDMAALGMRGGDKRSHDGGTVKRISIQQLIGIRDKG